TIVYDLWATSGRGDHRDATKRLVVGVGSVTLNYGGTNPAAAVKSYSAKILAAPLADGSSETFISLRDGMLYTINQGAEYAAFWDFGYYYTGTDGASLVSTSTYETAFPFVDVDGIAGTTELNNAYFAKSTTLTATEFAAISVSGDLDSITTPASQKVNNLVAGDIIEFVDNYGKKGVIKVVEVVGTFNQGDYIKIDIKVQP
ncbi:MAG: hypothetical protein OEX22_11505, partial [Cyclobacteriaceae bacterium]|nr:hypothetical protein [Cyclobacteriaceae bacterium]